MTFLDLIHSSNSYTFLGNLYTSTSLAFMLYCICWEYVWLYIQLAESWMNKGLKQKNIFFLCNNTSRY